MREIDIIPPPNPPAFSYRQARTYWLIVCAFTVFTGFLAFDYFQGRAKTDAGAMWLIVALNLAGHALLFPLMLRARRWEEQNRKNIMKALHAESPR